VRPRTALAGAATIAAVAAAGCGGGSSGATPKEDPGQVMKAVVKHELAGDRSRTYAMLVREQREIVSRSLYTKCSPGPSMQESDVSVGIADISDEKITVPALGETKTKAVRYKIDFHDGTDPIVSTGHLIAQEGHWRWTLSAASFDSLSGGSCP
jgi:hypothetical protein